MLRVRARCKSSSATDCRASSRLVPGGNSKTSDRSNGFFIRTGSGAGALGATVELGVATEARVATGRAAVAALVTGLSAAIRLGAAGGLRVAAGFAVASGLGAPAASTGALPANTGVATWLAGAGVGACAIVSVCACADVGTGPGAKSAA